MSEPPSNLGRLLASPHNTRLGPAIHPFNLPAEPGVCVGASSTCDAACDAKGFLFRLQRGRHTRNLERFQKDRFAKAMIAEIRRS